MSTGLAVSGTQAGLSAVVRPKRCGRERMDYNSSCNLIALGHETEESPMGEYVGTMGGP